MSTVSTKLSRKIARFSYMVGIASMVVAMLLTIIQQPASAEEFSQCGTGFEVKLEGTGPFTYTTSAGKIISQITLKAGQECITHSSNGNDGCYNVSGLGTQTVSLTRVGDGKDCKEISHVLIYTTQGSKPTEEPKVTKTITKPPTEPPVDTKTPTPVKTKTPPVKTPPVETPPVETPPVKTPPVETPPVETPPVETPPVETPPVKTPPVETPSVETPPVETPPVETPPVETPPVKTPPVETPPVETPPVKTPPVETPPAETPPVKTPPVETQVSTPVPNEPPGTTVTPSSPEPPNSTLPPPPTTGRGNQPPLLVPVTGADLSSSSAFDGQLQKLVVSLSIAFFGIGLVFTGVSKRKE